MSHVTNVILSVEIGSSIFVVSDSLLRHGNLVKVDHHGGGNKEMEIYLYIGAFNNLDLEVLIKSVKRLVGDYTLMIQGQHEENFRVRASREI